MIIYKDDDNTVRLHCDNGIVIETKRPDCMVKEDCYLIVYSDLPDDVTVLYNWFRVYRESGEAINIGGHKHIIKNVFFANAMLHLELKKYNEIIPGF